MKKIIYLVVLLWIFLLASCGKQNVDTVWKKNNFVNSWSIVHENIENNQNIGKKKVVLSEFEKTIIKISAKKWIENCKNMPSNKNLCEKIVKKEQKDLKLLNCDNLVYLKQDCMDKLNYNKKLCSQVKSPLLKRQCEFQKKYDEAIKNKDKSFCNTLPRTMKQECFEKILTK